MWLYYSLSPVGKYYMASSMPIAGRNVPSSVRWLTKTAPKRKPELVSSGDVVDGPDRKLPFQLSAQAQNAGWNGLVRSAPEKLPPAALSQALEDDVYDGVSVWDGCSASPYSSAWYSVTSRDQR